MGWLLLSLLYGLSLSAADLSFGLFFHIFSRALSRPRMQKLHSCQEYGPNMGRDRDFSIAKVRSRELRYHWYKYISLPLKCRLYSQILK